MCMGGKSSGSTAPPAPNPPTTFDYTAGNRSQAAADGSISQAQAGKQIGTTTQTFGAELGAAPALK